MSESMHVILQPGEEFTPVENGGDFYDHVLAALDFQNIHALCEVAASTPHTFNERELGTILAALRLWQSTAWRSSPELEDIATNGGLDVPLMDNEIDDLCERLNR